MLQKLLRISLRKQPFIGSQRFLAQAISLFACLMLGVSAAKNYHEGLVNHALILAGFSVCSLMNYVIFRLYEHWQIFVAFVIFVFSFLFMFLLASGGRDNMGLIWCMVYPVVAFPVLGARMGAVVMSTLIFCSAAILYFPQYFWTTHTYTDNMIYIFSCALIYVSAFAYLMERAREITMRRSDIAQEKLRTQAKTDELTGMFNRRGIKDKVQLELHRVARDKTEMSLVLCDVDLFKSINDRYGHDVGDAALRHISALLKDAVRITDMVGRWGGEEFLIALPNTPLLDAYQLIERVRERIANEPLVIDGHTLKLSMSCGLCSTQFCSRFDGLVKAADISLYEAKSQGRNCTRPVMVTAS